MRAVLVAAILALAGCQVQEPTLGGTVIAVTEAPQTEELEESTRHYEVLEVAWKVEVQLDDGSAVTVVQTGPRRREPGERVRLLRDSEGALLL